MDQGRPDQAAKCFAQALALRPDHAPARMNLGNVEHLSGRADAAAAAYRAVLALHPDFADAHANLGAALRDLGDLEGAAASLVRALALRPDHAAAHYNLGGVRVGQGRLAEAATAYQRAIALRPDVPEAHAALANLLQDQGLLEAAEAAYRQLVALRPDAPEAHMELAKALQSQGRSAEAMAEFESVLRLQSDHAVARDAWLCGLGYRAEVSPGMLLAEHRRWAGGFEPRAAHGFANDRDADRRLRIGYVSGDFRRHPVGWFLAPVLAAHNRAEVEVFCYSNDARADAMTGQLRGSSRHWREIAGLSDDAVAARIAEDGIDILVDLSGHTPANRLGVFGRRAAPVQASWLGYAATTGLEAMDYLVTDPETAPPGAEAWCVEALARLPHGRFCYGAPADAPACAPPPSLARGQVTFGSFNNLAKIDAPVASLWTQILRAVPGSRLVLKWTALGDAGVRRRVSAMFADAGAPEGALELRGYSPHAAMLAEYADVDIALDPFPFGGGLTSCEALWMGVPVATWPGDRFASRQTLSFLGAVGLADLAAGSAGAYVAIATALAADQDRRVELRRSLRARMASSPLGDGKRFTPALEAAYRRMWRHWCSGAAPQAFDLTSAAE